MRNGSKKLPQRKIRTEHKKIKKVKFNQDLMYGQSKSKTKASIKMEHNMLTSDIDLDEISFEDIL
jgi:hypothetical protein